MGLISRKTLPGVLLLGAAVCPLAAAPKLRLNETAVGPVSVAQGANGPARTLEAYNAGDGTLSLTVASSVPWLAATVGAQRACAARAGLCLPIQVALNTATLARGSYTGTLTVADPNALDAPQTVTVTVLAGGGVPDRLDLFVAPNGSVAEAGFTANNSLQARASTESGGNWLSVALEGTGSFRFVLSYKVTARHLPGMAEGTYRGSVTVSGAGVPADNKSFPVALQVTSRPIAQASPSKLALRYAQNISRQRINLVVSNLGLGSLSISGATAATSSGGNWLAAEPVAGYPVVQAVVDTAGLAPGWYQGTVSLATNASNATLSVPVQLEVVAQSAPRALAQGVVNNATFQAGEAVAQGAIAAVFGEQFTLKDPAQAAALPLPQELGGVRVLVNDRPAPVYYASYGQINFQVPYDAAPGDAVVRVERDGQRGNPISLAITPSAPRLLRLGIGDYGIVVNQDGTFPIPVTPGLASRPARIGDALVIYAIGLGPTTPAVAGGAAAPSDPLARVEPPFSVIFGGAFSWSGIPVAPLFAGLTPGFVGLYQINVIVPEEAPISDRVRLSLARDGLASNAVEIAIQ
ncbi:MAG: hypothetical protein HY822_07300 [Acidobacteria bacterium]|nr:hypothetical protein [Acidobacteriota bacterium]